MPYFWSFLKYYKYFSNDLAEKSYFWVIPTVVEIFYQFGIKALILVIPTVLETFYKRFCRNALLLVIP